jgi:hypothetical protein
MVVWIGKVWNEILPTKLGVTTNTVFNTKRFICFREETCELTHNTNRLTLNFVFILWTVSVHSNIKTCSQSERKFHEHRHTYRGQAVAQLIEALHYKSEGHGFYCRWCQWNFSLTESFWPHYGPGADSAPNRNEYQEYLLGCKGGRCVRLTTLPPSCADCLEIWEPQPPGTLRACPGL